MAKRHSSSKIIAALCPCESGKPYQNCCEPYHLDTPAPTAEALMRSRYAAYTMGLEPYLLITWHPDTRPAALHLDEDRGTQWLGLQVKQTETKDTLATVNFVARYKVGGKAYRLCELSQFVRLEHVWYYLNGSEPNAASN